MIGALPFGIKKLLAIFTEFSYVSRLDSNYHFLHSVFPKILALMLLL